MNQFAPTCWRAASAWRKSRCASTAAAFSPIRRADFADDVHIVRDFSENQVEVNTPVCATPAEAIQSLEHYNGLVQRAIANLPERELLWPFSNPPYILNEKDIPIAQYFGDDAGKTEYREYLSDRYGRYKMAFSGIHLNYSFGEALLRADYELARAESPDAPAIFEAYRDQFYVRLAENCVAYSWILTAVMAAEPGVRLLLRGEGPHRRRPLPGPGHRTLFGARLLELLRAHSRLYECGGLRRFHPVLHRQRHDSLPLRALLPHPAEKLRPLQPGGLKRGHQPHRAAHGGLEPARPFRYRRARRAVQPAVFGMGPPPKRRRTSR